MDANQSCNDFGFGRERINPEFEPEPDHDDALQSTDSIGEWLCDELCAQPPIDLLYIGPLPSVGPVPASYRYDRQRELDECHDRIDAMTVPQLMAVIMQCTSADQWIAQAARVLRERYLSHTQGNQP